MGNVGSTHHLHLQDVNGELHSYYKHASKRQQSHIQRCDNINTNINSMHWTRSLPHIINNARADAGTLERDSVEGVPTSLHPNYKVLPQVNERLKLRPTSNGVILFSGGTISGKREQIATKTEAKSRAPVPLGLKQRSRTFIYDDSKQVNWHYKQPTQQNSAQSHEHQDQSQSLPIFRRSQTLLHIKPGAEREQEQASKSLGRKMVYASTKANGAAEELRKATFQRQENDSEQVSSKQNKYNKKKKAPPAPSSTAIAGTKCPTTATNLPIIQKKNSAATMANSSNTRVSKVTASAESLLENKNLLGDQQTKIRLFRSNVKTSPLKKADKKVQEPQQQSHNQCMDIEKDFVSLAIAHTDVTKEVCNHNLQRREKSLDAILIRQKNTLDEKNNQALPTASVKLKSTTPSQLKTRSSQKLPTSKIPQLNRTFYFGMSSVAAAVEATSPVTETTRQTSELIHTQIIPKQTKNGNEEACTTAACDLVSDYKLHESGDVKPIVDNGLLIQVRPTLPRRQLNTPSFSPVAAWRMLLDQQQHQNLEQTCVEALRKQKNSGDRNNNNQQSNLLPYLTGKEAGIQCVREALETAALPSEAPIKLISNLDKRPASAYPNTWTPQQDLGDDEDEDFDDGVVNATKKQFPETIFSKQQNSPKCAQLHEKSDEQGKLRAPEVSRHEAIMGSTMSTSAMHVFSLSLPRDVHTQAQRKLLQSINTSATLPKEPTRSADSTVCFPSIVPKCCCLHTGVKIQQCLPLAIDDMLPNENHCPLHYGGSEPLSNLSDNWVLHKVKSSGREALNICRFSAGERYSKLNTKASVEPISLSYLTTGKHVMYLPSKEPNTTNARNGDTCRTSMQKCEPQQYKQRQKIVHQSLQDELTPPKSNVPVKDASGLEKLQQFTFQSTMRRLEKRRLAERLAKDVKLKEAQRKTELEAMKRVEDDFQRKRALEKANIRYQLQLHFNAEHVKKDATVTDNVNLFPEAPHFSQYDRNIHIACRADPEGAVSTPSPRCTVTRTSESAQNYSDCGDESDTDAAELVNFQHTETLLEPYLQSIIN